MRNLACIIIMSFIFISCGGKKKADGVALANEVCECRKKVKKGQKISDPEFDKLFKECSILQGENAGKLGNDKPAAEAYNKRLNECMNEMIDTMNSK